jgi:phosphoglycolate phosphatase-like HAD superfamily hydrolase
MGLDISRVRGLCFDVDGTISDTDDLWVNRFERFVKPARFALRGRSTKEAARRFVMAIETPGNLAYHLLDRLHLDDEMAGVFNFMAKHGIRGGKRHEYWIVPGVKEVLERLQPHYPMSVVSARDERSTLAFLDHFGLRDLFVTVVTAQTCTYTKPYPDPVLHAASVMGVKPAECLMIGDTTVDIRAGRGAGAQTVGVLCGFGQKPELERAGADLILSSTADLGDTLVGSAGN